MVSSKCHLLPPATKLGQGYVFTGVCHSVNGGEYLTRYTPRDQVHPPATRYTPGTRYTPPQPGTPPGTRYTPPTRDQVHPPGTRYTPPQPGTPLGPGIPPHPGPGTPPRDQVHPPPGPGRYGLRAGGTHPTGMHSCCYW